MRLAAMIAIVLFAAALAAGCGSSNEDDSPGPQTAPPARDGYGGSDRDEARAKAGDGAPAGASAQDCDAYAADTAALRATGVSCGEGRRVMLAWQRAEGCGLIGTASRGSCAVRSYRCLSVRTGRGASVSCAKPGRSIAFIAERG